MELRIQPRITLGKKVRNLRKQGLIPAEIFGHGFPNRHVSINQKDFSRVHGEAGEHTIINLVTEEKEKIPALISDVQYYPLKNEILAIDFHKVKMDEKIQIKVPIEFLGEAPAVKTGFVLVTVLHEIELEALPDKIPHRIEVDLNILEESGQSIRVRDIHFSKDVKILMPKDTVIATIGEKAKEEEIMPPPPAETEVLTAKETTTEEPKTEETAKEKTSH